MTTPAMAYYDNFVRPRFIDVNGVLINPNWVSMMHKHSDKGITFLVGCGNAASSVYRYTSTFPTQQARDAKYAILVKILQGKQ